MGRETQRARRRSIDRRPQRASSRAALMERLEETLDPDTLVGDLRARPAADRRDRARARAGRPRADHGRADLGAQRHRGRGAVPGHPGADRRGRGDRLHLPPPRGGARDRRPRRRPPRRAAGRRRRTPPTSTSRWIVAQMVGRDSGLAVPGRDRRRSATVAARLEDADGRRPGGPAASPSTASRSTSARARSSASTG